MESEPRMIEHGTEIKISDTFLKVRIITMVPQGIKKFYNIETK